MLIERPPIWQASSIVYPKADYCGLNPSRKRTVAEPVSRQNNSRVAFHYFALGPSRRSNLGGCGPRSTPRRLATLKICGSGASSLLAICSALCFLRASLISSRSFFIGQPPLIRYSAFSPSSTGRASHVNHPKPYSALRSSGTVYRLAFLPSPIRSA
jgi:hypothetical protein